MPLRGSTNPKEALGEPCKGTEKPEKGFGLEGFRGLGLLRVLGFRVPGFRVQGFRGLGVQGFRVDVEAFHVGFS